METAAGDGMEEQLGEGQGPRPTISLPPSRSTSEVPPAGKHRVLLAAREGTHRTHHDGHTGEQHSREKLPDPGEVQRGKLQLHSPAPPHPTPSTQTPGGGTPPHPMQPKQPGLFEQSGWNPEQGPVTLDLTHTRDTKLSNDTCCSPEPQRLPHSELYLVAQNLADLWTHESESPG